MGPWVDLVAEDPPAALEFVGASEVGRVVGGAGGDVAVIGCVDALLGAPSAGAAPAGSEALWAAVVGSLKPGVKGDSVGFVVADDAVGDGAVRRVTVAAPPTACSRHNAPAAPHAVTSLVEGAKLSRARGGGIVVFVEDRAHAFPIAAAIAKAFPSYDRKGKAAGERGGGEEGGAGAGRAGPEPIRVCFLPARGGGSGEVSEDDLRRCEAVASGVALAGHLVDLPPSELSTDAYRAIVRRKVAELSGSAATLGRLEYKEIVGEALAEGGFGGLYAVGKAAEAPPALVHLTWTPSALDWTQAADGDVVCLVGKGIVYDTGGLAIKSRDGMCGMKGDMGGSAGLLGAFFAAVRLGVNRKLHCVLCLAENAVGPKAFRNDDILYMKSGKSVEVNNTDAEGRLVLADGVAYASDLCGGRGTIIDMATLTGAQMVTSGDRHASILTPSESLERAAVAAGRASGDLVHPLLYLPEYLMDEFKSPVADMKNSVKSRTNAQCSCAGHFIEQHLPDGFQGQWLHVDMAGPSTKADRGTGYGVALVLELLGAGSGAQGAALTP